MSNRGLTVELTPSKLRDEWNAFVAREPTIALLQSWEWGEFKELLGWSVFRLAARDGGEIVAAAQMLVKTLPLKNVSVAYIPRGPIGRWLDADIYKQLFSSIHQIALQQHAIFLKIEPSLLSNVSDADTLTLHNFHFSPCTNQPRSTIVIDLTPDLDTIFGQMRKTTRRKIKDAVKKGVTIQIGSDADLPIFYELMKTTGERAGFPVRSYKYYQTEWQSLAAHGEGLMMLAFFEGRPIAAHVSYPFGNHGAFFHQASSNEIGDLNPNSLLVWEGIKWLKERGCHSYDLWGIPDEVGEIVSQSGELPGYDRQDGLWGVYQFKSGFGKNVVFYPGAYDYVYQRLSYSVISPIFSQANSLEQVLAVMDSNRIRYYESSLYNGLEELKFLKSPRDLGILFQKTVYALPGNRGLLNRSQKVPPSLQIEPTNYCNANCICCSASSSIREKGFMNWELFKKIIGDAKQLGVKRICLDLHGEPTLHSQIVEMIRYIKSMKLVFHMTTNGMLLNKEKSEEILQTGIDWADRITFSIMGDSEVTHNKIMKQSDLNKIQANIHALLQTRKELGVNGPVVETIFREMDENKYEGDGYKDSWSGVVDHAKLGGRISTSFLNYKNNAPPIVRAQSCRIIQERMTVYWNGDVTVCNHDIDGDYIVGNLATESIQAVWNGKQLSSLRAIHREKRFQELPLCRQCDL